MAGRSTSRTPPPRQLTHQETLETLTHWRNSFKTFYKKDSIYRSFLKEGFSWDSSRDHYGFAAETTGEKRTAQDLADDFTDLLNTLAGFLPHAYLTDKILLSTKNWNEVYAIIYEHYNVHLNCDSFMNFESMRKKTEETHRQFYERLLQHVKLHLAPDKAEADNITNNGADKMSITLMNMVTLLIVKL